MSIVNFKIFKFYFYSLFRIVYLPKTDYNYIEWESEGVTNSCKYVSSYYFAPKQLIMIGFIAYVKKSEFADSDEVDDIKWYKMDEVNSVIARENNCSGMHWDKCRELL